MRGRLRLGPELGRGEPQSDEPDGEGAESAAGSMKAAGIVVEIVMGEEKGVEEQVCSFFKAVAGLGATYRHV